MKISQAVFDVGFTTSLGESRRKILEGAVKVNAKKVVDFNLEVNFGDVIQLGSNKFVEFGNGLEINGEKN